MKKGLKDFDQMIKYFILGIMGIILCYLTALSIHSSSICYGETRFNIEDSFGKHLICYLLTVLFFVFFRKAVTYLKKKNVLVSSKSIIICISIVIGVFLLYLVVSLQVVPIEDQKWICDAAVGLRTFDFSLFLKNSYMDFFATQQTGIVLFLYGFFSIFGNYNYIAFQLMNVACILISFLLIVQIYYYTCCSWNRAEADNNNKSGNRVMTLLGLSAFLPFLFYVTYVYGTIIGLALALGAIRIMLSFFNSHEWKYMFYTALLCGLSVWIKFNYLIFVIAIVLFLLVDFWKSRSYKSLIGISMIVTAIYGIGQVSDIIVEDRIGRPLSSGVPMICYINMAFCEDENGNPVGYNGYGVNTYMEQGNDTDLTSKKALEDLKNRFAEFKSNPGLFIRFMAKKIAINWNEPEFESIHINTRHIQYNNDRPAFFVDLLQPYQNDWYAKYMNLFHAIIFGGGLTWILLCGKNEAIERYILAIIFIGGFLFSLFWESGSRYMLVYFLLLIPYAVSGYWCLAGKYLENADSKSALIKQTSIILSIMLIFSFMRFSSTLFRIHDDDKAYADIIAQQKEENEGKSGVLPDGRYVLTPVVMPDYGIASAGERQLEMGAIQPAIVLAPRNSYFNGVINLHHDYIYDLIRIDSTQLFLSLTSEPEEGNAQIIQDGDNLLWKIQKTDNSQYAILYNDYCLSVRNGQLTTEPYSGQREQMWTFVPAK